MENIGRHVLALTYGKPETKAAALQTLQQLSSQREYRMKMAYHEGLLPAVCALMNHSDDPLAPRYMESSASILVNLLLMDPNVDSTIMNTEKCLDGVIDLLICDNPTLQMLGATIADYLCVSEQHQITICEDFTLVQVMIDRLSNLQSNAIRRHLCQALCYISSQPHNVLSMIREPGIVEGLVDAMQGSQQNVVEPAVQCLRYFADHYDLQVYMASTPGCIDCLVAQLESKTASIRKNAKEILSLFADNPELNIEE